MKIRNKTWRPGELEFRKEKEMKNEPSKRIGLKVFIGENAMAKTVTKLALFSLVVLITVFGYQRAAKASEGGGSHYLPGAAGDILIAQSPKPGPQVAITSWNQSGDVDTAVLQGRVGVSLDLDLYLAIPTASYTFENPVLGGTYTMGIAVPFGYANLDARLTDPGGSFRDASADSFNLSDIAFTPFQLNWNVGNFSFKFAEVIVAPTGAYDVNDTVNLGRNYWSFDTAGGMTWFNAPTGTALSFAPGIMFNTENDDTNYQTGTEFHLDFVANQFLSKTFSVGIRGYYYKQITGDSGSGAVLGDFKSEAFGIGPGVVWIPKFAGGALTVLGKWMHDLHAENRFDSDYLTLSAAWKF